MDSTCPRESGRISSSTWVHLLRGLLLWSKFMSCLLFYFIHVLIWFWNKLFTASVFCLFGLNVNIFAKPGFCDCSEGTQTPNPATKLETGKKKLMKRFFFENYLFGGIVVPNVVVCVFHSKSNHLHGTLPSVLLKKVFWLEMNLTQISHLSDIAIKNGRPRQHIRDQCRDFLWCLVRQLASS